MFASIYEAQTKRKEKKTAHIQQKKKKVSLIRTHAQGGNAGKTQKLKRTLTKQGNRS